MVESSKILEDAIENMNVALKKASSSGKLPLEERTANYSLAIFLGITSLYEMNKALYVQNEEIIELLSEIKYSLQK